MIWWRDDDYENTHFSLHISRRMQALLEPFSQAYYFGRERVSSRYLTSEVQPGASFSDIKALCELSYPGQYMSVLWANQERSRKNFHSREGIVDWTSTMTHWWHIADVEMGMPECWKVLMGLEVFGFAHSYHLCYVMLCINGMGSIGSSPSGVPERPRPKMILVQLQMCSRSTLRNLKLK